MLLLPANATAEQVAQLLVLRTYWGWEKSPWADAEFTVAEIEQHYTELTTGEDDDVLQDARNDTRHHGQRTSIHERAHHSWSRNFDVAVRVIHLEDGRGLAYNYVTGGGKHGNPDDYQWVGEAWFVTCTGTQTVTTYTYEDIPEVQDESATE